MAIKRMFNTNDDKARRCLNCGKEIEAHILRDNKPYTCQKCGQVHLVDIYGTRAALTREEYAEFRRRHQGSKEEQKIKQLEAELAEARKDAREWEEAAEGLARIVEEMKEKERKGKQCEH